MHIAKRRKQKQYEEFEEKWGVLEGIMSYMFLDVDIRGDILWWHRCK